MSLVEKVIGKVGSVIGVGLKKSSQLTKPQVGVVWEAIFPFKEGDKVRLKSDGTIGIIADIWETKTYKLYAVRVESGKVRGLFLETEIERAI